MSEVRSFLDGRVTLYCGDCIETMPDLPENSVDSVVTDPPYHLASIVKRFGKIGSAPINNADEEAGRNGPYHRASKGFMGKQWDGGDIAFKPETWAEVWRVLKPGGHLLAFAAPRNAHRMVCAIEDAGFEIRDCLQWIFGVGFPKSLDVSKGIDRMLGAEREVVGAYCHPDGRARPNSRRSTGDVYGEHGGPLETPVTAPATDAARQWEGWGTALKPAMEDWWLLRKPLSEGTVAANVLRWGTGALNIGACRITGGTENARANKGGYLGYMGGERPDMEYTGASGRWPANVIHDGSDEVVSAFPETGPVGKGVRNNGAFKSPAKGYETAHVTFGQGDDGGSAARFFYSAKADSEDRCGSKHPTVKPLDLMQYLVRLVTPRGGTVLDCFAGSGTTGEAAWREDCKAILIEREPEYVADIERRMALALAGPGERSRAIARPRPKDPYFEDFFGSAP